jgi:hypothetical protein
MSKFGKLSEAFDQNKGTTGLAKLNDVGALRHSIAVINAVEKLKNQGIKITKKAKMDYLLALRFIEMSSKAVGRDLLEEYRQKVNSGTADMGSADTQPGKPVKRSPTRNPAEFEKAFRDSMKIVKEVEELQRKGNPVPEKLMETYNLCKRFLEIYT